MSEDKERIVSAQRLSTDEANSPAAVNLRPSTLDEFVGQDKVCQNLKVFIQSAKSRGEVLDHVLLYGPPGLGKTTLSNIISKELGVGFKATSAPMITRSGDLAAILTNLEARDVLFIDEIHRLNPAIEEVLYSAMEDFQLDIIIGEGPSAVRSKLTSSRLRSSVPPRAPGSYQPRCANVSVYRCGWIFIITKTCKKSSCAAPIS